MRSTLTKACASLGARAGADVDQRERQHQRHDGPDVKRQRAQQDRHQRGDEQAADDPDEGADQLRRRRLVEHLLQPEVRLDGQQRRGQRERGRPDDRGAGEDDGGDHVVRCRTRPASW